MTDADVQAFFAALAAANPHPRSELVYTSVFERTKQYGGKDAFRVVIAGDYAAHAASLDGLGLEIVRYDRQGFPEGAARAIGKSKGAAAK